MEAPRKLGRPTDDPKNSQIVVKLNEDCRQILVEYCAKMGVKRSEAVRTAIMKLLEDI